MTLHPTRARSSVLALAILLATGPGLGVAPALAQTPATQAPTTQAPATEAPAAQAPTTQAPASPAPVAESPATQTPATEAPAPGTAAESTATDTPATTTPATETAAPEAPATPSTEAAAQAATETPAPETVSTVTEVVEVQERTLDPALPHDLSPIGMYQAADWVVKAVMIGLAFASVVTWTVFVVKLLEIFFAGRGANGSVRRIDGASDLPAALGATGKRRDPASRMLRAAADEYDRSVAVVDAAGAEGLKERVTSHLSRIEAQAGRRMTRGTGLLATIGSTAPFVGLFGTVWGIMNSFIGIAESQTTNLAVVAPGIAEALLATAIGLVAAIPAVVIYNVFARAITGYRQRLADAAAGIERLVSRDLDFRVETFKQGA